MAMVLTWPAGVHAAGFRAPVPLGKLIATADAVVVGTILRVKSASFVLAVRQTLAGEVSAQRIEVEKFRAPPTSPRWADYGREQTVAVFLAPIDGGDAAVSHGGAQWRILGRIGEGEIPLDQRYAYFHGRTIDSLPRAYYRFHGQTAYVQRLERAVTVDAIRRYRTCFEWRETGEEGRMQPHVVCAAGILSAYRMRSPLHDFLAREATDPRGAR